MRARLITAALLALPVVELVVLVQVAHRLGGLPVAALVVASSAVGVVVIRHAGRAALADLARLGSPRPAGLTVDEYGRPVVGPAGASPGRDMADRALLAVAGLLLVLPGLIGSAVGLILLLPPGRGVARSLVRRAARAGLAGAQASVRVVSVVTDDPATAATRPPPSSTDTEPRAIGGGAGFDSSEKGGS